MWNRNQEKDEEPMETTDTRSGASAGGERSSPALDSRAIIGASITIEGEVTGDQDLTIQGHVDGSVDLDEHAVTVGPDGEVIADIVARVITVEGRVEGDLEADDQIVLRGTARVEGDISAPRVVLEDGSHFRGSVDMSDSGSGSSTSGSSRSSSSSYGGTPSGSARDADSDDGSDDEDDES